MRTPDKELEAKLDALFQEREATIKRLSEIESQIFGAGGFSWTHLKDLHFICELVVNAYPRDSIWSHRASAYMTMLEKLIQEREK